MQYCSENRYILGTGQVPDWCVNDIMPYKKLNGQVGYEYHGVTDSYELNAGDALVKIGKKIYFERERANEC